MTREEAIDVVRNIYQTDKEKEALVVLIPELAESDDERIRKEIIDYLGLVGKGDGDYAQPMIDRWIAYLEKQKENPKSADSIPSDCVSDAKCEDRWHKVGDSLPDNPREVLCKDEAGNYFIGRYYVGEGWEISNYDDEDKPHHLNPPVSKWIDFPSEKQKEQKPVDYDHEMWKNCEVNFEGGKKEVINNPEKYGLTKQKPTEWSEEDIKKIRSEEYTKGFNDAAFGGNLKEWNAEDEDRIRQIERIAQEAGCTQKLQEEIHDWLKSLRPSWKPSEEQMDALAYAIQLLDDGLSPKAAKAGEELEHFREQLKKL